MNSKSHYSWTVSKAAFQKYCLLSVEKVFTISKSISPSGISAIFRGIQGSLQSIYGSSSSIPQRVQKFGYLSIKSQIPPFSLQPNTCNQMAIPSLVYTSNTPVDFYFCNQMASVGLFWWPWADNLLEVLVAQSLFYYGKGYFDCGCHPHWQLSPV